MKALYLYILVLFCLAVVIGIIIGHFWTVTHMEREREKPVVASKVIGTFTALVYLEGDYAVAIDAEGREIMRSKDHAEVIKKALEHIVKVGGYIFINN